MAKDTPAEGAEKISKEPEAPSGKKIVYINTYAREQGEQTMDREKWEEMRGDGLLKNCEIVRYDPKESTPVVEDGKK